MEFDLQLNKTTLRIYRQGNFSNRPTIIFLHDSLGCITLWRDFPSQLGELTQCNILIYERQGYGKSAKFSDTKRGLNYLELEADVLHELIQQLKLEDVILFGHSDGGTIALITAAKYPTAIKGIITEGAHVFVEEITLKGIRAAVLSYQTTNLREKLEKYHGDKADAVFKAWTETWLSESFKNWDVTHFLPQINCPSLIIQGDEDEFGTAKQVDAIVQQSKGKSTKLMIPHVGHNPHKEANQLTLSHVQEFIASLIL